MASNAFFSTPSEGIQNFACTSWFVFVYSPSWNEIEKNVEKKDVINQTLLLFSRD